MGYSG